MASHITSLLAMAVFFVAGTIACCQASERPNIVLIMVDDLGFSDLGYHGGEIATPHLDALAVGGVRFSQFYNSGRCCPTRASLITGLHPHQTGIGHMTNPPGSRQHDDAVAGYRGFLNTSCVTAAEVLREAGYATMMTGKWHLGYDDQACWPLQRGFDRYYGCITGATRFFHPEQPRGMTLGNNHLETTPTTTDRAYYTTDAFTDYAITFISDHLDATNGKQPFFLYLAYTAPHWPLQAFEQEIAKYRTRYKLGWDKLREQRYRRQIELGLVDPEWRLSQRTAGIPAWSELDETKQDEMDLKMAVYAAMVDRVDQNVGKLLQSLKNADAFDNTLILFLSDNGACQEGGVLGRGEFYDIEKRNQEHNNSYGEAWANAGSTPFRLYKHFVHEGGAATPFLMHWPAGITASVDWYDSPAQLIDVLPTLIDVAAAAYPRSAHGNSIPALEGISLRPAFRGQTLQRAVPLFFEHENNAAVRDGDWKLVGQGVAAKDGARAEKWELYNLKTDRTETNNLADAQPERVQELAQQWNAWAQRVGVYPKGASAAGTSNTANDQAVARAPKARGNPLRITATVEAANPRGVILAHGGLRFGYALHFVDGRPAFSVRNDGKLTELIAGPAVSGRVTIRAALDGELMSIAIDDQPAIQRKSPGLLPAQPAIGLYLEQDFRDPVGNYSAPHRFNGRLISHQIEVGLPKVAMRTPWGEALEQTPAAPAWPEYPRPAMRRDHWVNLNGLWDYAVTEKQVAGPPTKWDGRIRVPFAIESPLSGVEQRVAPDDALWYRRTVFVEKRDDRRYQMHFEAVDYQSTLWINDREVGGNVGGNLPFSFDVTPLLRDGENTLVMRVTDATDTGYQLHGKQVLQPRGIWYTPVSGIWQTVWMEEVPQTHLTDVKIVTKADGTLTVQPRVRIDSAAGTQTISVKVLLDGQVLAAGSTDAEGEEAGGEITLQIADPQLWSPSSPTLYDLELRCGDDTVWSYFGIRETGVTEDADGHLRFTLNAAPLFHWGTLDQGWWPDGLLTPPSDEAMISDIRFLKAAGFNTIRKHIKVEPRRYYYHCDRLGMLVWQDHVSSGTGPRQDAVHSSPPWTRLQPDPVDAQWPDAEHRQFMYELKRMVDTLHNHPCIVQWVPFNEAWGQHRTMDVGRWIASYDPTRQVNIASGGNWFPVGDVADHHQYPHPAFPFELGEHGRFDDFVKVVGEFGGHGFPVHGHLWDPKARNWGYGDLPKSEEEWLQRYRESIRLLAELRQRGIAAGIYTQTTDVEGEINGLLTYDRRVQKLSAKQLREIHRAAGLAD